jgi:hypothetical protein
MPVALVCWEDDWEEDELKLQLDQIIELRNVIKDLPNKPVEAPNQETISRSKIKELRDYVSNTTFDLFESLDKQITNLSEDIFAAVGRTMASYYSPKWRFMSAFFLQNSLRLRLFLGGKIVDEVKPRPDHPNFGFLYVKSTEDIQKAVGTIKKCWELTLKAGKHNMDMTWEAKVGCLAPKAEKLPELDESMEEEDE